MSGHSHWAGIKRKKAVVDAKRAQKFTKLGKAITIAARIGGENPDFNPNLRLAIEKAKEFNMPKEKILNSIKKGGSKEEGTQLEEILYEALGPFGTMFLIEVVTDKKNRTISELRKIMESFGGKMADGGVGWNFKRKGIILFKIKEDQRETFLERALLEGVEDLEEDQKGEDLQVSILTEVDKFSQIKESLADFTILESKVAYIATNPKLISEMEEKEKEKVEGLLSELEDQEDVMELHSNLIF